MNRNEYLSFAKEFFGKCVEISEAKNKDYTGGIAKGGVSNDGSAFANFTGVEAYGVSVITGFITRMSDKLQRLRSFDANGTLAVKGESAEDACMDLANYASLCAGYLRYLAQKQSCVGISSDNNTIPKYHNNAPINYQFTESTI